MKNLPPCFQSHYGIFGGQDDAGDLCSDAEADMDMFDPGVNVNFVDADSYADKVDADC